MYTVTEDQVIEAEERLRIAMLNSDVSILDELISPDLLFTTHFGQLVGKQDDLQAHRSGAIRIHEMIPSDRRIHVHGSFAIVSVRMQVSGEYLELAFSQPLRYTRVWSKNDTGACCVVGGHISAVLEE